MGQLAFDLYKVDENGTREAVEKYLLQAREYKVTEYIPEEPSIIASYSNAPRSLTGKISDQTGSIAIANVDEPERRRRHVERAERAISRLGQRQQKIIRARYLDDDNVMDFEVAQELGFSDRHYRRIKSVAIYRLASILGLLVLIDE
jgi:ArpU family phage transcriptional regulator